jgi:hypothetical protein
MKIVINKDLYDFVMLLKKSREILDEKNLD